MKDFGECISSSFQIRITRILIVQVSDGVLKRADFSLSRGIGDAIGLWVRKPSNMLVALEIGVLPLPSAGMRASLLRRFC